MGGDNMSLENDLQLFWNSYKPLLECVRDSATYLSEAELALMYERLYLPDGWQAVSMKPFVDGLNQARELREEDGEGPLALAFQRKKANERTAWMQEIQRQHGLIIIGECSSQDGYLISYVSIPLGEQNIKFIPRDDGEKGVFIFDQPITREWADKGFLVNSFVDASPHGRLIGHFGDMDGSFSSAQLWERMNAECEELFSEDLEPAVTMKLAHVPKNKPGIKMIFFDLERLEEGEVDSFLRHVGYVA